MAISLVVLAVVVAIGFIKEVNLGFLSLGAAFVLGTAGGMSAGDICKGFSSSMFATLVGVTYLFGMASNNGTLELFSKKVVALVGKHTVLIPILMFVLSAFISAIGPGHIAAGILLTTFAMYLAFEMKINPLPGCQLRRTHLRNHCNLLCSSNQPPFNRWCDHHVLLHSSKEGYDKRGNEQDGYHALPPICAECRH